MRKAKAAHCEWYDFWGIAPENDPNDSWYNISMFKRKFGGIEIELVPSVDYVYDTDAYNRYLEVSHSKTHSEAGSLAYE
jgi:lipid II:glycine glycyltransferase (peptidoglycan interpeptide bridge formation enzyme)